MYKQIINELFRRKDADLKVDKYVSLFNGIYACHSNTLTSI